jgi:membrane protein
MHRANAMIYYPKNQKARRLTIAHPLPSPSQPKLSLRQRVEQFFVDFGEKFQKDRTTTLAASLAFYTVLSLAPLSVVMLFAFSRVDQSLIDRFATETANLIGEGGGSAILAAIESAKAKPITGSIASIASFLVVLISSGAMFAEIRDSLAVIFETPARPALQSTFLKRSWGLIRSRLLSAGFALTFVLVMAVSLVLSALLTAVAERLHFVAADLIVSFLLYSAIFTALFMYGTSKGLLLRDALRGGAATSALFIAGKILIGFYIGNSTVANSYGAAGSLVALLVWIYWATLIVFSGAQMAWLLSDRRARRQE